MKPIKGLDLDNRPSDISEGFCSYAKNVIKRNGRLETEKGLEFTDVTLPYPEIGKVEADDVCILFLTNNTNSEIGTFNYLINRSTASPFTCFALYIVNTPLLETFHYF